MVKSEEYMRQIDRMSTHSAVLQNRPPTSDLDNENYLIKIAPATPKTNASKIGIMGNNQNDMMTA